MSTIGDDFLTVAEVAALLKLNQQTVRNWIDQGSLPALRVGRRGRIRRSDPARVLEEASTAASGTSTQQPGPSAEDFWGGEPVGLAEPANGPGAGEPGSAEPAAGEPTPQLA